MKKGGETSEARKLLSNQNNLDISKVAPPVSQNNKVESIESQTGTARSAFDLIVISAPNQSEALESPS